MTAPNPAGDPGEGHRVSPAGSNHGDCGEMVSSSPGGGSWLLLAGHPAWGWLGGPTCWAGAVLGKYLPGMTAWLLNSCIIICTQLGYCTQSGTICGPYPAAQSLQGSRRLRPAAGDERSSPELGVTGERSTSVGAGGAAASEARHDPTALHLSARRPQG